LCRDLSELANYARVDNKQYRLLKLATPGPYTFILEATREVPRRVSHPQRKTIGLRVPDHHTLQELLALHGAPLLSTTMIPPGEHDALNDAREIRDRFQHQLAGVVDAGACASKPTTVIDLVPMGLGGEPVVVREGRGSLAALGL
jgi:tRNA threonylcarbamoyl adenosine modification protein (Sua5/YciO/YrdC/YwlC family)